MSDLKIYRFAGACGLAAIALFFVEFPTYFLRGAMPALSDTVALSGFIARNTSNIVIVVLLDMVIYCGFLVFLAGFRHLIRQASPQSEWLGTLIFGVGVVYTTLTLMADSLEGASALDALTGNPNASAIRALSEAQFLAFGAMGLILIAMLLALAGHAIILSGALSKWSGYAGYAGALLCLAFIPSMFAGAPDLNGFYDPAGWGPTGVAAGFPLAFWAVIVSIQMMRKRARRSAGKTGPSPSVWGMTPG